MSTRTYSRSLVGVIMSTAFAATMLAASFFVAHAWPPGKFVVSVHVSRHVGETLLSLDKLFGADVVAIAPRPADVDALERMRSAHDVLFASFNQPGQDWRISATAYRHIDPGRRLAI